MDIHAKSYELLEALANSIHDREPKNLNPFFFNLAEIHLTEKWLLDFARSIEMDIYSQ